MTMLSYVLKRIGLAFVTTFIILSLTFILIQLLPFTRPQAITDGEQFAYYQKHILAFDPKYL